MDLQSLYLLFVFSFFVGSVVGGTGIGGVLLAPYLVFVLDMDAQTAIASSMFAYIFSGLAAASPLKMYANMLEAMAV